MTQERELQDLSLEQLQSFEKIYAPFDGVVTARNTDIGDLINSGSGGVAKALLGLRQSGQRDRTDRGAMGKAERQQHKLRV